MTDPDHGDPSSSGAGPPGHPTRMYLTPLDANGRPSGNRVSFTGRVFPDPANSRSGLPIGFAYRSRDVLVNAYAWHGMVQETRRRQDMGHTRPDLRTIAERVFSTGGLHPGTVVGNDGHPDVLYEFPEHGPVCPVGWSMVVALTSTGLTAVLAVDRLIVADVGAEDYMTVMRTGYAHPSPKYVGEIARQLHTGERSAFAWDTTENRWVLWPVARTLVFERTGSGWDDDSWRETHRFEDETDDRAEESR